ncbi:hypothetical protein HK104_001463 [Borealophlyctis nickersoniae]|nr:hypothetical protein HK104_001463 [Borealophlyctis nickersoniae]
MGCCCSAVDVPEGYRRVQGGSSMSISALIPRQVDPTTPLRVAVLTGSSVSGSINEPSLKLVLIVAGGSKVRITGAVASVEVVKLMSGSSVDLRGLEYEELEVGDVFGGSTLHPGKRVAAKPRSGSGGGSGIGSGGRGSPAQEKSVSIPMDVCPTGAAPSAPVLPTELHAGPSRASDAPRIRPHTNLPQPQIEKPGQSEGSAPGSRSSVPPVGPPAYEEVEGTNAKQ